MTINKKTKQRLELRIVGISQELFDTISQLAEKEKRTISKQAQYMLEKQAEMLKNGS